MSFRVLDSLVALLRASSMATDTRLISSVPLAQSIVGLFFRSHGKPRMIDCLPNDVAKNLVIIDLPSKIVRLIVKCVMGPRAFGVLSTFLTGIGVDSL